MATKKTAAPLPEEEVKKTLTPEELAMAEELETLAAEPQPTSSTSTAQMVDQLKKTRALASGSKKLPKGNELEKKIAASSGAIAEDKQRGVKAGTKRGAYKKEGKAAKVPVAPLDANGTPQHDVVGSLVQGTAIPALAAIFKKDVSQCMFSPAQADMLKSTIPESMQLNKSVGLYLLTLGATIAANLLSAKSTKVAKSFTPAEFFAFIESDPDILKGVMIRYHLQLEPEVKEETRANADKDNSAKS